MSSIVDEKLRLDGLRSAHRRHDSICPRCGHCVYVTRNAWYDAHYCLIHWVWLEAKCEDVTCDYCVDRPETPV